MIGQVRPWPAAFLATGLAFIAGFADGVAYIRWHQFGANMTGNTVLFGIALARVDLQRSAETFTPIAAFCAGCAVAVIALRGGRPSAVPLTIEALVLAAAAFIDRPLQLAAIAFAMGMQNSSLSRFADVRANTSFITGDYDVLVQTVMRGLLGQGAKNDRDVVAVLVPLLAAYAISGGRRSGGHCGAAPAFATGRRTARSCDRLRRTPRRSRFGLTRFGRRFREAESSS